MSAPILKPKRELTYVYGVGVVKKSEFTPDHLKKLVDHVKSCGINVDDYIKARFEVSVFADLPLFSEESTETEAGEDATEKSKGRGRGRGKKTETEESTETEAENASE